MEMYTCEDSGCQWMGTIDFSSKKVIGKGAFGTCYLATNGATGRSIVAKQVRFLEIFHKFNGS